MLSIVTISKVPEKYQGKWKTGSPFRTSSTWFLASTNPHNPLVDEWLHCALTQARLNNQTVDNIWKSTMRRVKEAEERRKVNGPRSEKKACAGVQLKKLSNSIEKLTDECALMKKPPRQYVLSGDYWKQIQKKSQPHQAAATHL
jgi:hypothetical protein